MVRDTLPNLITIAAPNAEARQALSAVPMAGHWLISREEQQ